MEILITYSLISKAFAWLLSGALLGGGEEIGDCCRKET